MDRILSAFGNAFSASAAIAMPVAVAWGVLSVLLSPCHLSSVPLVVAYMSGSTEPPSGRRALGISSVFALGILASIAVIGAITAAAGRMLGDVDRWGTWTLAAVFFAVGLNLLGVFELPSFGAARVSSRRRGAFGALILGLVFGAALGPCTFAFMAPLLAMGLRASASDAAYGALLVALFGLGHAAAIAVAGAAFQPLQRWLAWRSGARAVVLVRRCAGMAVLAGGAYFVYSAL
jgi:cytochrome c-type biogenesis protein